MLCVPRAPAFDPAVGGDGRARPPARVWPCRLTPAGRRQRASLTATLMITLGVTVTLNVTKTTDCRYDRWGIALRKVLLLPGSSDWLTLFR